MPPLKINIFLNEILLTTIFFISLSFIVLISLFKLMYSFLYGFYLINQLTLLFKFLTIFLNSLSNILPMLIIFLIVLLFKYNYYSMILIIISSIFFIFKIILNTSKVITKLTTMNLFLIPLLYLQIVRLRLVHFWIYCYSKYGITLNVILDVIDVKK